MMLAKTQKKKDVGNAFIGFAVLMYGMLLMSGSVAPLADSPQFSALSAQHCPPAVLASGLLVQNGIGFLITVVSILVLSPALAAWGPQAVWLLLPGPLLGLWGLRPLLRQGD